MLDAENCKNIDDVRLGIDAIDRQIVALIGRRAQYVKAAARFKKDRAEVKAADRVAAMMAARRAWAEEEHIDPGVIESLFRLLVNHFIRQEMKALRGQAAPAPVLHLTGDALKLVDDVPGAKMWAVWLDAVMLTYFDIRANAVFDMHAHESEQITLVLEGDLYFKVDDREFAVKEGEAVAIPSNVPHAVHTKEKAVKAVDAWSPVRETYKQRFPQNR